LLDLSLNVLVVVYMAHRHLDLRCFHLLV
jgi:hypothetical protein